MDAPLEKKTCWELNHGPVDYTMIMYISKNIVAIYNGRPAALLPANLKVTKVDAICTGTHIDTILLHKASSFPFLSNGCWIKVSFIMILSIIIQEQ